MCKKIGILNYGLGNLGSVFNALKTIGFNPVIIDSKFNVNSIDFLIVPGVGSFDSGIRGLTQNGYDDLIREFAEKEKNILGICLGAQLLCQNSEEGKLNGLGLFDDYFVKKFENNLPLPNMGWNWVRKQNEDYSIKSNRFYFVHTYHFHSVDNKYDEWLSNYGYDFPCLLKKNNIYAAQFHPEKSLDFGLNFLNDFINNKL